MKSDFSSHCLKVTLVCVNVVFWLTGLAILAVGIWLMVDPSVVRMASIVHVSLVVNDSFLTVVATLFIALGIFVLLVGFCGCCGAVRDSKLLLSLYMLSLFLVAAGELTGGVYAVVRREEIKDSLIRNGVKWLHDSYSNDTVSRYFNSWMRELQCCGLTSYTDFKDSQFSRAKVNTSWTCNRTIQSNSDAELIHLPTSCCSTKNTFVTITTGSRTTSQVHAELTTNTPGTTTNTPGTTTNTPGTTTNTPGTTTNTPGMTSNPPGTTSNPPGTTSNPSGTTSNPPVTTSNPPGTTKISPETTTTTSGNVVTTTSTAEVSLTSTVFYNTSTSVTNIASASGHVRKRSALSHDKGTSGLPDKGCLDSLVASARSNLLVVVLVAYLVVTVKVLGFAMALCLCRRIGAD